MTLKERIENFENAIILGCDYKEKLLSLKNIEADLLCYQRLGTPSWRINWAREEIKRIRIWLLEEIQGQA